VEEEIVVRPAAAEQAPAPVLVSEPVLETVEGGLADEPPPQPEFPQPAYEPDQERRDKFFSRLSKWAKK
jgi:ribonuclease E